MCKSSLQKAGFKGAEWEGERATITELIRVCVTIVRAGKTLRVIQLSVLSVYETVLLKEIFFFLCRQSVWLVAHISLDQLCVERKELLFSTQQGCHY